MLDPPSQPGKPEPTEVTRNSATIHWKEPDSNGGSPITNYIVEYHDKTEFKWVIFNDKHAITDTFTKGDFLGYSIATEYILAISSYKLVSYMAFSLHNQ